jgi:5-carboxymethyl-2-hydroxymuconate isomerase
MPHIVFETTPRLSDLLDFNALMTTIHGQLVERGYARLGDLKSRVYFSDLSLAGAEHDGQFLVARLTMSNPRPPEVQREMGRVIHDAMRRAIEQAAADFWWQCCVFIETFDRPDYLKTDSRDLSA